MIADPLHLLDCCMISDGGGAVVIASPEVARGCEKRAGVDPRRRRGDQVPENGGDITASAARAVRAASPSAKPACGPARSMSR